MTKIMQIVTDISSPGGDHVYVCDLLEFLSKSKEHELFLLELRSHARGKNTFYYDRLKDLGVRLVSNTQCSIAPSMPIPSMISQAVDFFGIDIVHSHVFFTDLAAVISKLGSERYVRLLQEHVTEEELAAAEHMIDGEFNLSGSQQTNSLYLNLLPLAQHSVTEIGKTDFTLISTKHLGVVKSLCHEHDIANLYGNDAVQARTAFNINRKLQEFVSRHADRNVTIGLEATRMWTEFNPLTSYIPVGIQDIADTSGSIDLSRRELGIADRGQVFLFAGRLVAKKSPTTLVEAFCRHLERFPDDNLLIIGDGPLYAPCRKLAGDRAQIRFISHLPREQLLAVMKTADALCLFSLEEGLPLVIQEAMSSALPILSSAVGAIPDLVANNECGFIIPEVSVETITSTLATFTTLSHVEKQKMKKTAKEVLDRFPRANKGFEQYADLYRSLGKSRILTTHRKVDGPETEMQTEADSDARD